MNKTKIDLWKKLTGHNPSCYYCKHKKLSWDTNRYITKCPHFQVPIVYNNKVRTTEYFRESGEKSLTFCGGFEI